ncbi:Guanine nucleotide-binding protein subunit beta-2 [Gryllus bimaculatus]|nr:Guanine nucleotide-binding protein subunit beta-2 [Gryllus bimaculatus]
MSAPLSPRATTSLSPTRFMAASRCLSPGIETKFVGSSCNDVVTLDGSGSTIISGHVDKRVRFWDTRAERTADEVELSGKVTSLDLSRDNNFLLACARDNSLRILDLRMKQVIGSFSADEFKVSCDWARAAFSPDGSYVAAGSSDGSIFVWNVRDNKLETVLKEHTAPVTAVSFYPHGGYLMSVDMKRKAVLWADV